MGDKLSRTVPHCCSKGLWFRTLLAYGLAGNLVGDVYAPAGIAILIQERRPVSCFLHAHRPDTM